MIKGHFYFLTNEYFKDYPDKNLMRNKELINNEPHNRPCYYSFEDENNNISWLIPISSKVEKYKKLYNQKLSKNGQCDTLVFGEVLGRESVFLIQNMCPVTDKYVSNVYLDSRTNKEVRISKLLEKEIKHKASKILALERKGYKLIFPNVLDIEKKLLNK